MTEAPRPRSPYTVMAAIGVMYAFKVAVKLAVGGSIGSPMIASDGFHNLADIFETALVAVAVMVARLPPNERYPFGRKNVESVARAAIGVALVFTALHFAAVSLSGALSYAPSLDRSVRGFLPFGLPAHEPLRMDAGVLPWVLAVTSASAALSYVFSRYEIRAGKRLGHASMVAAGREMRGDGLIEIAILVGVSAEYAFRAAWLEYPFGFLVSAVIAKSGWELFIEGWHALLQHSLGREAEDAIRETCVSMRGVTSVEQATTFRVGSRAVVILKIITESPAAAHDDLKKALKLHLAGALAGQGIEDAEFHLRFSPSKIVETRVAYAVASEGETVAVAPDLESADGFLICTVENGEVIRWTLERPPEACDGDLLSWLEGKRVVKLCFFGDRQAERHGGVTFAGVPSYDVDTLGLNGPDRPR